MAHPGKKLLFMGQEFGQFIEWNYEQELDWLLLDYDRHRQLQSCVRDLNRFYLDHPQFWQIEYSWEGFTWIANDDNEGSTIAFMRKDEAGEPIISISRFVPNAEPQYRIGVPDNGVYSVLFNTDDEKYGGSGFCAEKELVSEAIPMHGFEQSVSIPLAGLSTMFLKCVRSKKNPGRRPRLLLK